MPAFVFRYASGVHAAVHIDGDPVFRERLPVERIQPHAKPLYHFQMCCGGEHLSADFEVTARQDIICTDSRLLQLLLSGRAHGDQRKALREQSADDLQRFAAVICR